MISLKLIPELTRFHFHLLHVGQGLQFIERSRLLYFAICQVETDNLGGRPGLAGGAGTGEIDDFPRRVAGSDRGRGCRAS
jgi:hypothetical protein